MSLLERVNHMIIKHRLFSPGDRIIVAVSGGPDSIGLLRVLDALSSTWAWSLCVAHLDHGFRGAASRADGDFVERLAEQLGWPIVRKTIDLPVLLAETRGSAQDISRQERYQFLRQVAAEQQADVIGLAHHQGDQAETVLLHLLRGAGPSGLAGMAWREGGGSARPLVRPLLQETRQAILQYLMEIGQGFRVDQSNAESHYQRNRVRLEILPGLQTVNSDVETALARTAVLVQAEDQLLTELAEEAFRDLRKLQLPGLSLPLMKFRTLPLALRRRVLRLAWRELTGFEQDLEFAHVEAAIELLEQAVGAACNWPRGFICRRDHHQLLIAPLGATTADFALPLTVPGHVRLPADLGEVRASILPHSALGNLSGSADLAYCDLGQLRDNQLLVRNWLPGDEFQPLGMQGRKKLQDFFGDSKIDRSERHRIPLVVHQGQIVWVAGRRLNHSFRVTPCTNEVVCLEYRHSDD